jgi:hypothetical protein
MMGFLSARQIRVFDYPRFAEPLRDRVRDRAAELASAAGVTIEHIAKRYIRKEDVVAKILAIEARLPEPDTFLQHEVSQIGSRFIRASRCRRTGPSMSARDQRVAERPT